MENLARIHKHELEPEPEGPVVANDNEVLRHDPTHPDSANDNEKSQPIATLYPELSAEHDVVRQVMESTRGVSSKQVLEAANMNAPLSEKEAVEIAGIKERLGAFAEKSQEAEDEPGLEQPLPRQIEEIPQIRGIENIPVAAEAVPGHIEEGQPQEAQPVQAAGGVQRQEAGGTSGTSGPEGAGKGGAGTLLGKLWKLPWKVLSFAFKALVLLPIALATMLVAKISSKAVDKAGFPDAGKKKG